MFYIFGGNGFVGRYLANELAGQNKETTVIDLHDSLDSRIDGKVSYIKADIRNLEEMRSILFSEADTVINLAANQYHTKVPKNRHEYFFNTNTVGTKNILTAMTEKGCKKLIQFTTDMTYGKPQYLPVDIKHPQNPFGPYGESKKACEEICRDFRNNSRLSGGGKYLYLPTSNDKWSWQTWNSREVIQTDRYEPSSSDNREWKKPLSDDFRIRLCFCYYGGHRKRCSKQGIQSRIYGKSKYNDTSQSCDKNGSFSFICNSYARKTRKTCFEVFRQHRSYHHVPGTVHDCRRGIHSRYFGDSERFGMESEIQRRGHANPGIQNVQGGKFLTVHLALQFRSVA